MKKLIVKPAKRLFRFLWPEKKKWSEYNESTIGRRKREWLSEQHQGLKKDLDNIIIENLPPLDRMAELNAPDPSLPVVCPTCGNPTSPSKIDDRLVACISCKQVFMTDEARNDPNIMRDLTHANAGITPRMTTIKPRNKWEQIVRGWWEQSDKNMSWEDYWADLKSHGHNLKSMYDISREKFNKQKREKLEDDKNGN